MSVSPDKSSPPPLHESSATRELRSGFAALRFRDVALEQQFRQTHWRESRVTVHLHLWLSMILVASFILIDQLILQRPMSWPLLMLRVIAVLTLCIATALTAKQYPGNDQYHHVIPLLSPVFGACAVFNELVNAQQAVSFFPAIVLTTFGIYLLFGLLFKQAVLAGLSVMAIYLLAFWQQPLASDVLIYNGTVLLFTNLLAASACYSMERLRRTAFLEANLLTDAARRDGLTGIYNRRAFDEQSNRLWQQASRAQQPLALLLIDIDHFKAYNDYYGHQVGDQCLQQVANILGVACQRPLDFTARYGGEEFAVMLYDVHSEQVHLVAERIQAKLQQLGIAHPAAPQRRLTASIGVACVQPTAERTIYGCIQLADEALYEAKEAGRDRIVIKDSAYAQLTTGAFRQAETLASYQVN